MKEEKRKCPECNKLTLVSEGIEKLNNSGKYDARGKLYSTKRCADCGYIWSMHLHYSSKSLMPTIEESTDKRPKIPLKPLSENLKGISGLLWLGSWITLILSLIMQRFEFTILFWLVILSYSILCLKSNIAQCFQKKYIGKSLLYLPLLFIPKFLCEELLARANIWWLNLGISFNFLFGSATSGDSWITFFITLGILILLFFPCNYYEEYYFRERWYLVGIWALLHLFLGFSQFTLGELFILCGLGIGFKLIYDKHGIQVSYPTHVFVNLMTVFIALLVIFL